MRILYAAPLALSLLAATDAAAQDCSDPRARAEIAELSRELETEVVSCREAARADLDGDGARDAVLSISYEGSGGGNNWGSLIYVLLGDADAPLLEEPEEARGPVDSIAVVGREIRVRTAEYREGDGRCCPSGHGAFALRVEDRRLVRVPRQ